MPPARRTVLTDTTRDCRGMRRQAGLVVRASQGWHSIKVRQRAAHAHGPAVAKAADLRRGCGTEQAPHPSSVHAAKK